MTAHHLQTSNQYIHTPLHTFISTLKVCWCACLCLFLPQSLPVDPNSQLIKLTMDDLCECTLRTSGTEPKIKYYIEISSKAGEK